VKLIKHHYFGLHILPPGLQKMVELHG